MDSKKLGVLGEKIARDYLKKKGYKILDKNYFPKFISGPKRGEIDIIAKRGDIIIFTEVKTLAGNSQIISPEEKVDFFKKRKLIKTAQSWLMEKNFLDKKWQIDIISIKIDYNSSPTQQGKAKIRAKIRHFQNAIF